MKGIMKKLFYILAIISAPVLGLLFVDSASAANVQPLCTYTLTSNVNSNMNLCDDKLSQIKYVEFLFGVNSNTHYMSAGYNTFTISNSIGRNSYMFGYDDVLPYSILQNTAGVSEDYPLTINFYDQLPGPAQEPCPEPIPCPDCNEPAIVQLFKSGFWGVATALTTIIVPILALFLIFRIVHDLLWGKG